LRQALDMFWKANNELRQFAQLTSHDLKTPLATVMNLCDEALDEFGEAMPTQARELVAAAKDRSLRMSRMIDELLASMATPEDVESTEPVSSQEALDEAIETTHLLLAKNGINLDVPRPLPWVLGNKVRLREVFVNLLSNAAKFIDRRPGQVTVEARIEGDQCVIAVADNGPGIPKEELERIFSPFRRLPLHHDRPGTGLGLYFTKNLVDQQGGAMWVESKPGEGSRFHIRLKRAEPK
jgi:signal transduction histidine kinase